MRTWLFKSVASSKEIISEKRWTRHDTEIALESVVSFGDCVRRVIGLRISFRCTTCSRLGHSFVTMRRRSRRDIDMIVRVSCLIKWIAFTGHWTRRDIWLLESIVSLKKLRLSCYWLSSTFSLYDLIVTRNTICSWLSMSMSCKLIREF